MRPDLQRSATLANAEVWQSVLIDGVLKNQAKVSFARVMTPDQTQSVRYYVVGEANRAKTNLPAEPKT